MFDFLLRDSSENIRKEADEITRSAFFNILLEGIPSMILILNKNRQIVYMNRKFAESLGKRPDEENIGLRPGECLLCIHAGSGKFGCGSTDFCQVCGFANSIRKSEGGLEASDECNITLSKGETLTFSITTQPFIHNGKQYIFAYMQDISDVKTRQLLENIFLHDINNSITALNGLHELIDELPVDETKSIIKDLALRLTDEIHSYRLISEAESHQLMVSVSGVKVDGLIDNIIKSLQSIKYLRNRKIEYIKSGLHLNTDETLLRRVLINAIKNALEASTDNQAVTISAVEGEEAGSVSFRVKSLPVIPAGVQLQLFQRSFSTKGAGRGWGTYSIRLLTESYLGGKVGFISNEKQRTVFTISIPSFDNKHTLPIK